MGAMNIHLVMEGRGATMLLYILLGDNEIIKINISLLILWLVLTLQSLHLYNLILHVHLSNEHILAAVGRSDNKRLRMIAFLTRSNSGLRCACMYN